MPVNPIIKQLIENSKKMSIPENKVVQVAEQAQQSGFRAGRSSSSQSSQPIPESQPQQQITTPPPSKPKLPPAVISAAYQGGIIVSQYNVPFGVRLSESFQAATDLGVIGQSGFEEYRRRITEPFEYQTYDPQAILHNPPQYERGTIIRPTGTSNIQTEGLSIGQAKLVSEIGAGVALDLAGLPSQVKYDVIQEQIGSKFQSDIDRGIIQYETPEEKAAVQKSYQQSVQQEIETVNLRSSLAQQPFTRYNPAETIFTIGETAALGAATLSPIGSVIAGGYLIGQGEKAILQAAFNKDLSQSQRALLAGEGIFVAGLGLTSVKYAEGLLSRQNVQDIIAEQQSKEGFGRPYSFNVEEVYLGERGGEYRLSAQKKSTTSSFAQEIEGTLKTFRTGENTFSITGGKAQVNTRIYDVISGRTFKTSEVVGIQARGQIVDAKAFNFVKETEQGTIKIPLLDTESQGQLGSFVITRNKGESFIGGKFGGIVKETEEGFAFANINPRKLRINREGNINLRGELSNYGIITTKKSAESYFPELIPKKLNIQNKDFPTPVVQELQDKILPGFIPQITEKISQEVIPKITVREFPALSSGQTSGLITRQIAQQFSFPRLEQGYQQSQREFTGLSFVQPTVTQERFGFGSPSGLGNISISSEAQTQLQVPKFGNFLPPVAPPFTPNFTYPREPFPFFGLPFIPTFGFDETPRRIKKGKRRYKRTPSVYDLAFGITSLKPLPGESTGLVSRPILSRRKRVKGILF